LIIYDHRDNYTALVQRLQIHQEKSSARSTIIGIDLKPVTVIIRLENTSAQGITTHTRVSSVVGDCSCFLSLEVNVKSLDEIDQLLAKIEKELTCPRQKPRTSSICT
jgi:hypothetical protein